MRRVHDQKETGAPSRQSPIPKPVRDPDPDAARPSPVEAMVESLQRTAGNTAVSRLLARDGQPRAGSVDGESLPPAIKAAGERRLGADLSDVRVHTDAAAGTYAESLGGEAVTVGRDVFLGSRPGGLDSARGRKALMHELVHTVQAVGQADEPVASMSSPDSAAEREASAIGAGGFSGARAQPTQVASAGVVHRKVAEEDELKAETMPDLLNPAPLTEDELKEGGAPQPPKAGELGENEAIAFEIRVLAPLRGALAAASDTEWETAYERMQDLGNAIWEYEEAYAKRDPALVAELRGIRGWLALATNQIKGRFSSHSFSDQHIADILKESTTDLQGIGKRLG